MANRIGAVLAWGLLLGGWGHGAVAQSVDWPSVGNDKGGTRYSPLRQIHTRNVDKLEVAWVFHTGDAAPGAGSTIECTPIVVEGVMYVTSPRTSAPTVRDAGLRGDGSGLSPAALADASPGRRVCHPMHL